jgi:excisionase family DNA binding protein
MQAQDDNAVYLLGVRDVAARLGVSVRTAWTLISLGQIPTVKVGPRATRVHPQDLERFISERRARAGRRRA